MWRTFQLSHGQRDVGVVDEVGIRCGERLGMSWDLRWVDEVLGEPWRWSVYE